VIVVVEAMKMEHEIRAPRRGIVVELRATVGAQVEAGDVLAVLNEDAEPGEDDIRD
jgi:biotin carboxyl carrier protein